MVPAVWMLILCLKFSVCSLNRFPYPWFSYIDKSLTEHYEKTNQISGHVSTSIWATFKHFSHAWNWCLSKQIIERTPEKFLLFNFPCLRGVFYRVNYGVKAYQIRVNELFQIQVRFTEFALCKGYLDYACACQLTVSILVLLLLLPV